MRTHIKNICMLFLLISLALSLGCEPFSSSSRSYTLELGKRKPLYSRWFLPLQSSLVHPAGCEDWPLPVWEGSPSWPALYLSEARYCCSFIIRLVYVRLSHVWGLSNGASLWPLAVDSIPKHLWVGCPCLLCPSGHVFDSWSFSSLCSLRTTEVLFHISGFESLLCFLFKLPANANPERQQLMAQVLRSLLTTWQVEAWETWLLVSPWPSSGCFRHLGEVNRRSMPFSAFQLSKNIFYMSKGCRIQMGWRLANFPILSHPGGK